MFFLVFCWLMRFTEGVYPVSFALLHLVLVFPGTIVDADVFAAIYI